MLFSPCSQEKREQFLGAEHGPAPALASLKARLQLLPGWEGWEGHTALDDRILLALGSVAPLLSPAYTFLCVSWTPPPIPT